MSDVLTRLAGLTERTVTTTGDRAAVCMTRSYEADVGEVWDAWTNPARLGRWLGTVTGDLTEGGEVQLRMTPDDVATLEILRCDAPRRLAVRWSWPGEPDSIVELALLPAGPARTTLTLEHVALGGLLPVQYGGGWEDFLFRLGAFLAGDDPGALSWDEVKGVVEPPWQALVAGASDDGRWPAVDRGGSIRVSHDVPATIADTWLASTRDLAWFGAVSGSLAVGGEWEITFEQGSASGTVQACEPERSFVTSWRWGHDPAAQPPGTVTVTLTTIDGGTRVELRHDGAGEPARGYAAGWYAHLRGLQAALAGRRHVEADWQADWEAAVAMLRT